MEEEYLAAEYSSFLLGRGCSPQPRLTGQQAANAPSSGVCRAEPGLTASDRAGNIASQGVTTRCQQRWLGMAVPRHWVSL